jgi:hypothetical protein
MKHMILLIAILACSAQAQQQSANCLQLKKVKISHILHQEGVTWAELTLKTKDCSVVEEHDRLTVTFASKPGLDVTLQDIGFKRSDDGNGANSPAEVKVKEVSVILRLVASPDLPVGENTLHGMLSYRAVNHTGAVSPETLAFDIPLKVAPPKPYKPYKPHDEPSAFMKGLQQTGVIALEAIIAVPALLFMLIYCPISGDCPTC